MKTFKKFFSEDQTPGVKAPKKDTEVQRVRDQQNREKEDLQNRHEREIEAAQERDLRDKLEQQRRDREQDAAEKRSKESVKENEEITKPSKHGVLEYGTDKATKTYKKDTPGQ